MLHKLNLSNTQKKLLAVLKKYMNVQTNIQPNFKGYDARPLKGFIMSSNCRGIAEEMAAIGKKENFKIFAAYDPVRQCTGEFLPPYRKSTEGLWAQDLWMIVKNKLMSFDNSTRSASIKKYFNLEYDFTENFARNSEKISGLKNRLQRIIEKAFDDPTYLSEFNVRQSTIRDMQDKTHIAGGNIFLVKNGNKDEILVGEDELKNYTRSDISKMYCADKVITLPQMDFHLDLFIRPLDEKKVLLADDNLTLKLLKENSSKYYEHFRNEVLDNNLAQADKVAKILEKNDYEVIRVPARIYSEGLISLDGETYLKHLCNYINANVLKNSDGDLVYITNKSDINKKVGFDFENAFIESISPYIKKEKIYFIHGENNFVARKMLKNYHGGIHCACTEVL